MPLERCFHTKQWSELYCSGCSRRGHLVHTCRGSLPFASHPINSPYVCVYRPLYTEEPDNSKLNKSSQDSTVSSATTPNRMDGHKRMSKSPTAHENHFNKKRTTSATVIDEPKTNQLNKIIPNITRQITPLKEIAAAADNTQESTKNNLDVAKVVVTEKAPDFIPISSSNHDKKGQVIQDNEVSDTSDVVTSARIYVTNDVFDLLRQKEHQDWLKKTVKKLDVTVQCCGGAYPFLSIKGKVVDQESFQYLLRDRKWSNDDCVAEAPQSNNDANDPTSEVKSVSTEINLPKNRYNLLRQLTKALDTLQQDLGDPKAIHKELTYLQTRHEKLLTQKVISPKTLSNNRTNINNMLKRLNTVLLGQAGLANGADSVIELYSYKDKLSNLRQNTISLGLRKEIGQHFHSIFSSNARDDYSELLQKYDPSKPLLKLVKNKKKDKTFMPSSKLKKITGTPSQQENLQIMGPGPKDTQKSIQLKKLMFYHQRLKNAKPKGPANKKAKLELIRKVHTFIASMFQKETLSSKSLKKVKKAQEEAQNFLSENV